MAEANAGTPMSNPAVVGLAGFGLTTLLLQFHNLGWMAPGAVFCAAMALGGGMQIIAGFQEFKTGNNFGYCAFCVYGGFWLALGLIFIILDLEVKFGMKFEFLAISGTDVGWFMVGFTIFTAILWIASLRIHAAMAFTFTTLLIGFIGLDMVFLGGMKNIMHMVAWDLVLCALAAWYMMAHVIFLQVFGTNVLPVGKPLIAPKPAKKLGGLAQATS